MDKEKVKEILYVLPLALIIGVTPLIVHYKKVKLGKVVASYWIRDYNTDFFSYYKTLWFLGCVLLALISFYIYYKKEKKVKKTIYYLPAAVYMAMIVISTVLSECPLTSLVGFPDRYEGMPVLLGYMLVLIITINLINTKRQIKFLLTILLISAIIIGIIGLYQFFGMDFFQSYIGKRLILPSGEFNEISSKINFRLDERNIIYSTFYNPNYVGSYFVMLFMLSLLMYVFAGTRQNKILYGTICLLMFANWLGSLSRAGILGGLFSLFVTGFILKDEIIKRWRSVITIMICFVIVFTLMDVYTDGKLRKEFLSFGKESKLAVKGETARIQDIETKNGFLIFTTKNNSLKIGFNNDGRLTLMDGNGTDLTYYSSNQKAQDITIEENNSNKKTSIYINDNDYNNYKIVLYNNQNNKSKFLELHHGKKQVKFVADIASSNFWIIGMKGNIYPIQDVESWGFDGRERLASSRGYIWSRSLPLIKKSFWTGLGPDSYAIFFPQHDAVGKLKAFRTATKIVDKPHNYYLQVLINTGFISLIAVIILFGIYFFSSIYLYWKSNLNSFYARAGLTLFAVFTGYVVAAVFNDSIISVAPVFWTLLGLGIVVNLKVKEIETDSRH